MASKEIATRCANQSVCPLRVVLRIRVKFDPIAVTALVAPAA